MPRIRRLLSVAAALLGLSSAAQAQQDDPACLAQSFQLFSTFEGFYLESCEVDEFGAITYWTNNETVEVKREGRRVRLQYAKRAGSGRAVSGPQVIRNYATAVRQQGGTVVPLANEHAFSVAKAGRKYWVVLDPAVTEHSTDVEGYQLRIVREEGMQQELASTIAGDLASKGRIALYGILFDVGKSVVRSESGETIKAIADYLTANPTARVLIVGHTDMTGDLAANLTLSKARAAAVVAQLTATHGIAAARLAADGVGPLSPVATNATDEGRQQNRRVEVVLR